MNKWIRTSEGLPKNEYEYIMFKLQNGHIIGGYYVAYRYEWWTGSCAPIKFKYDDVYEWRYATKKDL